MVRVERPAANPKEPLSVEEARKLLTSTRDDGDQAAWAVMLLLGLRRSDPPGHHDADERAPTRAGLRVRHQNRQRP